MIFCVACTLNPFLACHICVILVFLATFSAWLTLSFKSCHKSAFAHFTPCLTYELRFIHIWNGTFLIFLIPNIILQVTNLTFWLAFTVFKIWALIFFTSKFQLLTAHESYHLNVKLLNLWPPGLVCYFLESQDINSIHC